MLKSKNTILFFFLFLAIGMHARMARAQCSATINTFPYNEGFESGQGNWNPSSSLHWQWGTPGGKTLINSAGGGSKCWVAGGLSGTHYESTSSTLISPCFDFSTLSNPEISLKVFWETEYHYDGAHLQYTINNGSSWVTVGTENSNDPCAGIENWYNHDPVRYIDWKPGWSGNVQTGGGDCLNGSGSGQWVIARHPLGDLAGRPNVKFRFVFGAGTECNNFDGFAIDDIHIGERPSSTTPDFTYACGANSSTQFTNNSIPCQTAWDWNFGDPGSGADNVSSLENPAHTFSSPGTYNVSLTVTYASGVQVVVPPKNITIPNVTTSKTDIKCNGDQNGSITVHVDPPGTYHYNWNTTPVQNTATINNLEANIPYTVTVTATNMCSVSIPTTLTEPAVFSIAPVVSPAKCGNNNGSINANAAGGTTPYTYTWSNGESTGIINNLAPGSYDLSALDANGCTTPAANNLQVQAVTNIVKPLLGKDTTICPGQTLLLRPGSFATYKWQDNSTQATYPVTQTGDYAVEVTDADGCTGTASVHVTVDCKGVYFPSAFTPGQDHLNPGFGVIGDLGSLKNYSLVVYNRYAQVIFTSSDPYKKWDGTFKGSPQASQAFVWTAKYTVFGQQPVFKKGTILLIR